MPHDTFPLSTLFHFPILQLLADGKEYTQKDFRECVINALNISEEDQKETVSEENKANKLASWVNYAVWNLRDSGFITNIRKGVYVITEKGKAFYATHKDGFVYSHRLSSEVSDTPKAAEPEKTASTAEDGVVYILTNPAFKTYYIKIGFTTNIEERLKELYNTSVPLRFHVYALLNTSKYKQAEKMLHSAFKGSRIGDDREFFYVKPEEAFDQMKIVAEGLEALVIQYDDKDKEKKRFDFRKKKDQQS